MKLKLFVYLVFAILIIGFFFTNSQSISIGIKSLVPHSFCDTPTAYKIGVVDARFGVSPKQFSADIVDAANIWDKAYGKQLFQEKADAKLAINLVFDERQALTNKLSQEKSQISTQKGELAPQIQEYNNLVNNFKKQSAEFTKQVNYWNSRGGAPEDEYNKLQVEQQDLQNQVNKINELASKLNISSQEINSQVSDFNQTVNDFNTTLSEKPEEGIYDSQANKIDIYFNVSKTELEHTLAHELGHALGMQHVQNQKSIMFARTNNVLVPSQSDLAELADVCRVHSLWENVQERFSSIHKIS